MHVEDGIDRKLFVNICKTVILALDILNTGNYTYILCVFSVYSVKCIVKLNNVPQNISPRT